MRADDKGAAPDVSIVVVSYNSEPYLERSLGSVAETGYELIVVDNASRDCSRELVRRRFPSARLIELDTNVGFGSASNVGIEAARGRYLLLLNPDAWPVRGALETLTRFVKARPRVGAAGPRLRSPAGRAQRSAFGYPTPLWLGRPAVTSQPTGRAAAGRPRGRYFLVGTALLLRREAVEEVGGFDERFFMFNEEIDLCWRLHEAGWGVELCPDATFVHVGGASTADAWPELYRQQLRGHLLFVTKHRGPRQAELARRVLLASARARARLAGDEAGRAAAAWLASGSAQRLLDEP